MERDLMGRALSSDLRERVLNASQEDYSAWQAAARFGVSATSSIRWIARAGQGETRPRKPGRESTSRLAEDRDMKIGRSMLSKWLRAHGFSY